MWGKPARVIVDKISAVHELQYDSAYHLDAACRSCRITMQQYYEWTRQFSSIRSHAVLEEQEDNQKSCKPVGIGIAKLAGSDPERSRCVALLTGLNEKQESYSVKAASVEIETPEGTVKSWTDSLHELMLRRLGIMKSDHPIARIADHYSYDYTPKDKRPKKKRELNGEFDEVSGYVYQMGRMSTDYDPVLWTTLIHRWGLDRQEPKSLQEIADASNAAITTVLNRERQARLAIFRVMNAKDRDKNDNLRWYDALVSLLMTMNSSPSRRALARILNSDKAAAIASGVEQLKDEQRDVLDSYSGYGTGVPIQLSTLSTYRSTPVKTLTSRLKSAIGKLSKVLGVPDYEATVLSKLRMGGKKAQVAEQTLSESELEILLAAIENLSADEEQIPLVTALQMRLGIETGNVAGYDEIQAATKIPSQKVGVKLQKFLHQVDREILTLQANQNDEAA